MTLAQAPQNYQAFPAPSSPRGAASQATTIEQSRAVAEVQAAVIVAQNVPRDIQRAAAEMRETCGFFSMAEQAFYSVPNRGTGPSVHLMRELARIWGNIEHGSHELNRDDTAGESEVQAFAWDKQTNTRTSRTFIAPHERMKGGSRQRLTDLGDIQNNNNNVAARAVRECIANVLPRWFTEEAQNICRATLEHGEGEPLDVRANNMIAKFAEIDITAAQIEAKLQKKRGQWDSGDLAQMAIVYTSITRDNHDKNEVFPPVSVQGSAAEILSGDGPAPEQPKQQRQQRQQRTRQQAKGKTAAAKDEEPAAEQPAPAEDPAPAAESAAEKPAKSPTRKSLDGQLAKLFADSEVPEAEDQLIICRFILGHSDIPSIDALNDVQAAKVVEQLFGWQQKDRLDQQITDILNSATLALESGEQSE